MASATAASSDTRSTGAPGCGCEAGARGNPCPGGVCAKGVGPGAAAAAAAAPVVPQGAPPFDVLAYGNPTSMLYEPGYARDAGVCPGCGQARATGCACAARRAPAALLGAPTGQTVAVRAPVEGRVMVGSAAYPYATDVAASLGAIVLADAGMTCAEWAQLSAADADAWARWWIAQGESQGVVAAKLAAIAPYGVEPSVSWFAENGPLIVRDVVGRHCARELARFAGGGPRITPNTVARDMAYGADTPDSFGEYSLRLDRATGMPYPCLASESERRLVEDALTRTRWGAAPGETLAAAQARATGLARPTGVVPPRPVQQPGETNAHYAGVLGAWQRQADEERARGAQAAATTQQLVQAGAAVLGQAANTVIALARGAQEEDRARRAEESAAAAARIARADSREAQLIAAVTEARAAEGLAATASRWLSQGERVRAINTLSDAQGRLAAASGAAAVLTTSPALAGAISAATAALRTAAEAIDTTAPPATPPPLEPGGVLPPAQPAAGLSTPAKVGLVAAIIAAVTGIGYAVAGRSPRANPYRAVQR